MKILASAIFGMRGAGLVVVSLLGAAAFGQQRRPDSVASPEPKIVLPVEVIGPDGFERVVSAQIANPGPAPHFLVLQVHGLAYADQAELQINDGMRIPIRNENVTIEGIARNFGGIGGPIDEIQLRMRLPAGAVIEGANSIRFRFIATDGASSGYRVLALNIVDGEGRHLLNQDLFEQDDPANSRIPGMTASDIEHGRWLWSNAELHVPDRGTTGLHAIHAHCGDCHTRDGRDLAYFNYSNQSIIARSQFHGLGLRAGQQIASYIRQLPGPHPGRPWNPPYQPGPGLDSKPVAQWAAGAGLSAVAANDEQTVLSVAEQNGNVNIRETPVNVPFPDWNHWLPRVHPMDALGDTFTSDPTATSYLTLREKLKAGDPAAYYAERYQFDTWTSSFYTLYAKVKPRAWTSANAESMYSLALWRLVKEWELAQEFQFEGMAPAMFAMFGKDSEPRAWYSNWAFRVSPNMLQIPFDEGVLRGYTKPAQTLLSMMWYQLQLTLNGGNGLQDGPSPVDWPYVSAVIQNVMLRGNTPEAGLEILLLNYGLGMADRIGRGPDGGSQGWSPWMSDPSRLVHPAWEGNWKNTPPVLRTSLTDAHLRRWWASIRGFSQDQWIKGRWVTPGEVIRPNTPDGSLGERIYFMLPRLRAVGVDPVLIGDISDWAASIWPQADWTIARRLNSAAGIAPRTAGANH